MGVYVRRINMHSDFLVDDNLSKKCNSQLDDALTKISSLKGTNDELKRLLRDKGWEGDTHDKCAAAIEMMEQYRADLETLCKNIKNCVDKVVADAGEFVDNSDKVAAIKKV